MLVGALADTVMNLVAFAFIGAMAWLWIRPLAPPGRAKAKEQNSTDSAESRANPR